MFSVRVGDTFQWSKWSPFSVPVTLKRPVLSCSSALRVSGPVNRKVIFEWAPLCCDVGRQPVEYQILMLPGDAEVEPKSGARLVASFGGEAVSEENVVSSSMKTEVDVVGFEPGALYEFVLYARPEIMMCTAVASIEVARSSCLRWPSIDLDMCIPVNWTLPVPEQAAVPEDSEEHSTRWQGNAVLITWPAVLSSGAPLTLEMREEAEDDPVYGWKVANWTRVNFSGCDFVVVVELPFTRGRFRWRDSSSIGPVSDVVVAFVPTAQAPATQVFCTRQQIRVRVQAAVKSAFQAMAVFRVRHRKLSGPGEPPFPWRVLPEQMMIRVIDATYGEEDGLEQGAQYVFGYQLVDGHRRSLWSADSEPVLLALSAFESPGALSVHATTPTSVTFRWPQFSVPLELEFRLDVYRCFPEHEEHQTSSKLGQGEDDDNPVEATVCHLLPSTQYRAELSLRAFLGEKRSWHPTGLTASFVMPGLGTASH